MKVYFIVEEEGGEVYATNDKEGRFFDYRFLVDSCVDGADEWEYFDTKEQALSYVARRMGGGGNRHFGGNRQVER